MKKLNYFLTIVALVTLTTSCQEDIADKELTSAAAIGTQIQLPADAPEFVVELRDYLVLSSESELEGRSDELSIYEYLCYKPDLSTFKTLIDLVPGLRLILNNSMFPITVFAPTNAAFDDFLAANGFTSLDEVPVSLINTIVGNHILLGKKDVEWLGNYMKTMSYASCNVRGRLNIFTEVFDHGNATINGMVNIIRGNQFVGRGFVHVVDKVIAPSTLVDFVTSDPQFSTLVQALTCPSLGVDFVSALSAEDGVFTIFAPTNEAFDKLAAALGVASVCDIPAETLATVLSYHVKPGVSVSASMLARGKELHTLAPGLKLNSVLEGTQIKIVGGSSTATVILQNLQANNGIIHGIDMVLLP